MKARKVNKTIILTFDYELFMKESGTPEKVLINPTNILRELLNRYNIKATFFVDILYYKRLLEDNKFSTHANLIKEQLQTLLREGHRLELHLHPQWQDASFDGKQWIFPEDMTYRLQSLPTEKIFDLFKTGKKLLEDICKSVKPDYEILAFRAGGLCITPFDKLKKAFTDLNIKIDSSIAKGFKVESKYHNYDFLNAPDLDFYKFEDNPLIKDDSGNFIELPISVYKINLSDKIKLKLSRVNYDNQPYSWGEGKSLSPSINASGKKFKKIINKLLPYKMPFSLDYVRPELIINKIKKSKKGTIIFLSHNKFLSPATLKTIEKMIEIKFYFKTLTFSYE
jgi:hypothetical protein